ncbi:hypothetical protein AAHH80_31870, partial [Burkholderia pseudomallei]
GEHALRKAARALEIGKWIGLLMDARADAALGQLRADVAARERLVLTGAALSCPVLDDRIDTKIVRLRGVLAVSGRRAGGKTALATGLAAPAVTERSTYGASAAG